MLAATLLTTAVAPFAAIGAPPLVTPPVMTRVPPLSTVTPPVLPRLTVPAVRVAFAATCKRPVFAMFVNVRKARLRLAMSSVPPTAAVTLSPATGTPSLQLVFSLQRYWPANAPVVAAFVSRNWSVPRRVIASRPVAASLVAEKPVGLLAA